MEEMEGKRNTELDNLKEEKEELKKLVEKQTSIIKEMEQQLVRASSDNSAMKQQQQELTNTVNNLIHTISLGEPPTACVSIPLIIREIWDKTDSRNNIMPTQRQLFKCLGKRLDQNQSAEKDNYH